MSTYREWDAYSLSLEAQLARCRAERKRAKRIEKAAQKIRDAIGDEACATATEYRRKFPGSGGQHFITHVRVDDLAAALAESDIPKETNG